VFKITLKRILKVFIVLLGGLLGYAIVRGIIDLSEYKTHISAFKKEFIALNGAFTGMGITYFTTSGLIERLIIWIRKCQENLNKVSPKELIMGGLGGIIGLVIASLINITIIKVPYIGIFLSLMCNFLFAYFGTAFFLKRKEVLDAFSEDKVTNDMVEATLKVIDTCAIIDGRIVDVCKTGFVEGTLIIPEFILKELRHIADSHDHEKRTRGRRGLEILNIIQKELKLKVEVLECNDEDLKDEEVDIKLLKLAKKLGAKVITTDYNLNRIAEFQGITVLNINVLSNAIKPVALPGDQMMIRIIKDGKESGQGIGYLDDGTMVVVDEGKKFMGEIIEVDITHVLQTSTGKMIFAKPKFGFEDVV